ncbi:DUF2971 domain-containing protein [Aeromonas jandaei]|uniref:DUF2971 domain-containing protein n=1 Tax=Aeromonas jandaei TaxID=650 RepID=A0A7T4A9X3_AERJA|nr:DUF2971 domain-containing protein [Aeromonas jandaei]QQB20024.1 DUF2971 domain-containing protein [Aeromonas jandaei]UCA34713.1 DUF2971 domain-containing protein [Aeromonas jandaei]
MTVLYKYYTSSFDLFEHLDNPAIKLATTKSLNDPFESQLTDGLANILTERFINKNGKKHPKSTLNQSYKEISNKLGIVSLTETHRNILMWAHYASSHHGVCIGYKDDFFNIQDRDSLALSDTLKTIDLMPQRVKYDSKRFDEDAWDNSNHSALEMIVSALSTKSDEWMYEKEHRCIVPLVWADRFVLLKKDDKNLKKYIDENVSLGNFIEVMDKSHFNFKVDPTDKCLFKNRLAKFDGVMMLKNISIDSIQSIYLGSLYGISETSKVIKYLKSDTQRYGHIKLYKYEINENDFALDIIPLNDGKKLDKKINDRALIYKL